MTVVQWFEEYGKSHRNLVNRKIHKVCVPLITWSLIGILWTIPVPDFFLSFHFNWSYFLLTIAFIFYLSLKNLRVILCALILMLPIVLFLEVYWSVIGHKVFIYSLIIFILAWIGQFIGHKIEGVKPSFFKDLQFLLIGPIWIFKDTKLFK